MLKIGLQTFTVKKAFQSTQEIENIFSFLSKSGIKHIELAVDYLKMPFSQESAKKIYKAANLYGIQIVSCQIKYSTITKDIEKTSEYMKSLCCNYITLSSIDINLLRKGKLGILEFCKRLNELYDKLKEYDIELGHHHHHFEFIKASGETVLDIIAENFKGEIVLDTYWVQKGGGISIVLLEKLKGRISRMHIRDFSLKMNLRTTDCELGKGNLPFTEILSCAQQAGVNYAFIEQKTKTPEKSLDISINHLKDIKFI